MSGWGSGNKLKDAAFVLIGIPFMVVTWPFLKAGEAIVDGVRAITKNTKPSDDKDVGKAKERP